MRKLPFVAIRVAITSLVVIFCYLLFKPNPTYLAILGIALYGFLDLAAYPIYAYFKSLISPPPDKPAAPAKKPKKKPAVANTSDTLDAFMSLDRKLDFIIYFDAPEKSLHQLLMWMPSFLSMRMNYIIVLRQNTYEKELKRLHLPVITINALGDLTELAKTKAKVVFYVNNGMRNTHLVREIGLTHIQLLHGDSDKPASFNPVSAMYDYLFVSGQLAIDRYAKNGVEIPEKKFKIIGRPQAEGLNKFADTTRFLNKTQKTVFYTSTWAGFQEDTNFSSIKSAPAIIETLLELGYRVIFRPHPHSYSDVEDAAIIDAIADRLLQKSAESGQYHCVAANERFGNIYDPMNECINASDILLSDISSVVSDWLYSGNPYIMIDTRKDKQAFLDVNEMAKGGYYVDTDFKDFESLMKKICTKDPMHSERMKMRKYALGMEMDDEPTEKFSATMKLIFAEREAINKAQAAKKGEESKS